MTTEPPPVDLVGGLVLTHRIEGDTATITLAGDVDHASSGELMDLCLHVVDQRIRHLVLDCGELAFMDSAGLRTLIGLRTDVMAPDGDLVLRHVPRTAMRVLEVTGLVSVFTIEP